MDSGMEGEVVTLVQFNLTKSNSHTSVSQVPC